MARGPLAGMSSVEPLQRADDLLRAGSWRSAADAASAAYRSWCEAPPARRAEAYVVYRAAEQREAAATAELRLRARFRRGR
jgi:hypothetical protein